MALWSEDDFLGNIVSELERFLWPRNPAFPVKSTWVSLETGLHLMGLGRVLSLALPSSNGVSLIRCR
jgi:hypothetical protein